MLEDILRDTPVYQEVLAEGIEKGLEKGLEAQRQTLLDIVQERFPEIARLAKQQADVIEETPPRPAGSPALLMNQECVSLGSSC